MINAKVGDKVMIVGNVGFSNRRWIKVFTVEKETKTQIQINMGDRYMRSTGFKVGEGGHYNFREQPRLIDFDDELFQRVRAEMAFYKELDTVRNYAEALVSFCKKINVNEGTTIQELRDASAVLGPVVEILSKGKK